MRSATRAITRVTNGAACDGAMRPGRLSYTKRSGVYHLKVYELKVYEPKVYEPKGIRTKVYEQKNYFLILTWTVESLRVVPEAHTNISSNQHNQHNNQQSGGQSVTQYNHAGQLISQPISVSHARWHTHSLIHSQAHSLSLIHSLVRHRPR